jgi:hypothetical protein
MFQDNVSFQRIFSAELSVAFCAFVGEFVSVDLQRMLLELGRIGEGGRARTADAGLALFPN